MGLTRKEKRLIKEELPKVKEGDLYSALHRVGNDPVKAEIEDILERMLPEGTYKEVLAVFNIATRWD